MVDRLRCWSGAPGLTAYLDNLAEYWIGHSVPPVGPVVARSGFAPDKPAVYCGRCGESIGRGEATASGCGSCRAGPPLADRVVRLGRYEGDLRRWILAIKYGSRWAEMGVYLGSTLAEAVIAAGVVDTTRVVVIPMPMPWQRRLYRGIDHARVLADGVGRRLGAPVLPVLGRTLGPPQVSLARGRRRRSGRRGMWLRRASGRVEGRPLLLVDDVRTTGSTLRGAVRLLRRASPECVVAAVVAVADNTARRTADVSLAARSGVGSFLPGLPSAPVDRIAPSLRI